MTVSQLWEYRLPFNRVQGNVERHENGNTLIATGNGKYVIEVIDRGGEGDELIKMRFPAGTVRAEYYPAFWNE